MADERYNYEASKLERSEAPLFYTRDMMMNDNSRRLLFTPQYFDPDLLKVCLPSLNYFS